MEDTTRNDRDASHGDARETEEKHTGTENGETNGGEAKSAGDDAGERADEQATAAEERQARQRAAAAMEAEVEAAFDALSLSPAKGADDEEALRRLLRETVEPIRPSPAALVALRAAVPARQRRRRQLLLGAAASVALLGFGMPLAVQSAATIASGDSGDAAAGTEQGRGSISGTEAYGDADGYGSLPSGDATASPDEQDSGGGGGQQAPGGEEATSGGDASETLAATSPDCTRDQLGDVETTTAEPDAEGIVYGSFRLANVSAQSCRVDGHGDLAVFPFGVTGMSDVQILDRTEGDRATGLPAPDESYQELILPPGEAYEVQFAWVPDDASGGCVAEEPDPDPSTDPTEQPTPDSGDPSSGSTDTATSAGTTGTETTSGETEGTAGGSDGAAGGAEGSGGDADGGDTTGDGGDGTVEGGVTLQYTPAAGEPEAAEIVLEGACSGTIYRTGVLEAPTA